MATPDTKADRRASAPPAADGRSWLLFVHQLPARPTGLRVRTWRRLQQIGAIAVKQAVYVLPDSPDAREDFEWLKTEIEAGGGSASVFAAGTVDAWSNDALVEEFRRSREDAYAELAREADRILRRTASDRRKERVRPPDRSVQQLRARLSAIEQVDFFGSAGRDRVLALIRQLEESSGRRRLGQAGEDHARSGAYRARLWVTRPRPAVDRMASAWLIRRFIDVDARFGFAADRRAAPAGSVPFDMFGVEFTHRAALCTFEVLRDAFQLSDPALTNIAQIVHDLDLKDGRFAAADAPTIGRVIDGLRLAQADDHQLLADGMALFEALYRVFAQATLPSRPRPVAKRAPRKPSGGRTRQ